VAAEDVDENRKGAFIFDLGEEDKERERRYIGAVNSRSVKASSPAGARPPQLLASDWDCWRTYIEWYARGEQWLNLWW